MIEFSMLEDFYCFTFPRDFSCKLFLQVGDRVFNYFLSLLVPSKGVGDDRIFDDRRFLLLYLFP